MAKLKLQSSPARKLDLELPDGETVTLTIKRILKKDSGEIQKLTKKYQEEYYSDNIDANEFYDRQISLVVEDYDPEIFNNHGVEVSHMKIIADKVNDLLQNKEEEEKKSQE